MAREKAHAKLIKLGYFLFGLNAFVFTMQLIGISRYLDDMGVKSILALTQSYDLGKLIVITVCVAGIFDILWGKKKYPYEKTVLLIFFFLLSGAFFNGILIVVLKLILTLVIFMSIIQEMKELKMKREKGDEKVSQ